MDPPTKISKTSTQLKRRNACFFALFRFFTFFFPSGPFSFPNELKETRISLAMPCQSQAAAAGIRRVGTVQDDRC